MRAAPPVDAALAAGRAERMLITLLHSVAGCAVAVWVAALNELATVVSVAAVAVAAAAAMAALGGWLARQALPADGGHLRWDGQGWSWLAGAGQPGPPGLPLSRLDVAIDLGRWALLRLRPAAGGRPVWRVASARAAGPAWHGLRVALLAHGGEPAGPPAAQDGGR